MRSTRTRNRNWKTLVVNNIASQSSDQKRFFVLLREYSAAMGSCISASRSESELDQVAKIEKKEESDEIEETPVVEFLTNCPTNAGVKESLLELAQETGSTLAVSSSVEVLDIESDEQSLSDISSFLSEEECDIAHPQDLQEDFSFEIRGKSCLPRNTKITGLVPQNEVQSRGLAPVEITACLSSRNECKLPQGDSGDDNIWARESPGPSGYHSNPNISLPPPRPSQWQRLYSQELKEKEQLADEKLKRKLHGHEKKKAVSLEEKVRARSIRIIKKIKKSMRLKAAQDPNSGPAALPPDEAIAAMFGVTVEDCRDSTSVNSSSSSRPSSRLSSSSSRHISITRGKKVEEDSLDNENYGQQSGRKSRKWFRLKYNKVAPL